MSYAINRTKDAATQGIIDSLKIVNFNKIPQVIFLNTHSSCPEHIAGTFLYKGISALNLAMQPVVKGLANEQGVVFACTSKQWKHVPKQFPVINVRYSANKGEVYSVPLYSYASPNEAFIEVNCDIEQIDLSGLSDLEQQFVWQFISWRLGEDCLAKNFRLGFKRIYELSALADSFINYTIQT